MRPSQDMSSSRSATPIYDALCSEYRRAFRTLPGDRSNEENTGFTAFGTGQHGSGLHGTGLHGTGPHSAGLHTGGPHSSGHRPAENAGFWQRQSAGTHVPAALPPGPRRAT
ncbi:hypothetical protein AB0M87_28520 [Streptomyces sp. NPDC051320]|uniref:hypothetical protein n=1 Tax=Streptomyces sp. NPDC051320 TaxID=3154644 RepID=UPI0034242CF9